MKRHLPTPSIVVFAIVALSSASATAQPAGFEEILGVWHQNDWQSIAIGADTVTYVTPDGRWAADPTTCPVHFEHVFEKRTPADILDWFGFDGTGQTTGAEDAGFAAMVMEALPETAAPIPTVWSYCAAESHGGTLYVLNGPETLAGISSVEGDMYVETYGRQVPPPSHDDLSSYDRIQVQETLTRLGFYDGELVYEFGPLVEKAIRAYQRSIGAEPSGILTRSQVIGLLHGP